MLQPQTWPKTFVEGDWLLAWHAYACFGGGVTKACVCLNKKTTENNKKALFFIRGNTIGPCFCRHRKINSKKCTQVIAENLQGLLLFCKLTLEVRRPPNPQTLRQIGVSASLKTHPSWIIWQSRFGSFGPQRTKTLFSSCHSIEGGTCLLITRSGPIP